MALENVSEAPDLRKNQWMKISGFNSRTEKSSYKCLYIGENAVIERHLFNQFQTGQSALGFADAKKMILNVSPGVNDQPYDVIFIDAPYNRPEVKSLFSFLKRNRLLQIVLIYNGIGLSSNCVKSIRRLDIVDDILDIRSDGINYSVTIPFLKQSKRAHKLRYLRSMKKRTSRSSAIRCISFVLKRILDIVVALIALIIFFPLFLVIAIIIKLESKGPVFYTSPRAGKGYKVFRFHKFRTMVPDADQQMDKLSHLNQYDDNNSGPVFYKIQNDPRVTRFGRFLRNTSLDEIPQFINVLKGDMSLVGNRPLPLYEAAALTTNECVERFSATAGITGLWQVKKRGKAEMSVDERINLDITYARNENLFYDLWIMLCTPVALMQKSDV